MNTSRLRPYLGQALDLNRAFPIVALLPLLFLYLLSGSLSHTWPDQPFSAPFITQAAVIDVAVSSISPVGAPAVYQGDIVTFQVGVKNNGTGSAAFQLKLHDDTDNVNIGSTNVTLAAGGSDTVSMEWDTSDASGGPPPPGPPDADTIHPITATVVLTDDSNSANDSMTYSPGIWIIEKSTPKITFPESQAVPQASLGQDLTLANPSVATAAVALTNILVVEAVDAKSTFTSAKPQVATTPQAMSGIFRSKIDGAGGHSLTNPQVDTVINPREEVFLGKVQSRVKKPLHRPTVGTEGLPLAHIDPLRIIPAAQQSLSAPTVATAQYRLRRLFSSRTAAKSGGTLLAPVIDTGSTPYTRIRVDYAPAQQKRGLLAPSIDTRSDSADEVYVISSPAGAAGELANLGLETAPVSLTAVHPVGAPAKTTSSLANSGMNTAPAPLTTVHPVGVPARTTSGLVQSGLDTAPLPLTSVHGVGVPVRTASRLAQSGLDTAPAPLTAVHPVGAPAKTTSSLVNSGMNTAPAPLTTVHPVGAPAKTTSNLAHSGLDTAPVPLTNVHPVGAQAKLDAAGLPPQVSTQPTALSVVFVSPGPATFQAGKTAMENPLEKSFVQGKVTLQGRHDSRGAYIEVGTNVFFAGREGAFEFEVPQEPFTLRVQAPGYTMVTIRNVTVAAGQTLTIPEITLTFGDANGDGKVTIYDLALVAGNFGQTDTVLPLP